MSRRHLNNRSNTPFIESGQSALARTLSVGALLRRSVQSRKEASSIGTPCRPGFEAYPNRVSMCVRVGEWYGVLYLDPTTIVPDVSAKLVYMTDLKYDVGTVDFNSYNDEELVIGLVFPGVLHVEQTIRIDLSEQNQSSVTVAHSDHYINMSLSGAIHERPVTDPYIRPKFILKFYQRGSLTPNKTVVDLLGDWANKKVHRIEF